MTTTPAAAEAAQMKRYHHGDLRRALLDAASAILERLGPSALSLRAVAREAGVSPAAPYHHFKDKEQLIAAVAREGFARLKATLTQVGLDTPPGKAKAGLLGLAYVDFALAHPALYRVMYDCARRVDAFPDDDMGADGGFSVMKDALAASRGPNATDTDIHLAAIAAWCAAHGLAEMRGFSQFRAIKAQLGGEDAFLRGVMEHIGVADALNRARV